MTEEATQLEEVLMLAECLARLGGYKNISMQGVAGKAGLSISGLYRHFPSKEQLAVAVVRRFAETVSERIGTADDPMVSSDVKLDILLDVYRQSITDDGQLCLFLVFAAELHTLPKSVQEEVHKFYVSLLVWMETLLKRFDAYGAGSGRDAKQAARAIVAALNGAQICVRSAGDRSIFEDTVTQLYASGLAPRQSPSGRS